MRNKLGVIVNPIAGMGGRVGLKGTDTPEIVRRARALGATPEAPRRATETLLAVASALGDSLEVLAGSGAMGEEEARQAGLSPVVLGAVPRGESTPEDTRTAARAMAERDVDLLLFAGGDGTARDLCEAVGEELPVLGVPAGVKIHSAVYATSPRTAADLAVRYLRGEVSLLREAEVMDIDEEAFRRGAVSARLYGYMRVPNDAASIQGVKVGRAGGDEAALAGIAAEVIEKMKDGALYVVGPGTTTRAIAATLGVDKTLLGVDLIQGKRAVLLDATEEQLLRAIAGIEARIVVTPIGGQGHIFGRGNQPISPQVIRKVGKQNLIVVATPEKLASLRGRPLLVDSGDAEADRWLSGYIRVVTGYRSEAVCAVSA